MSFTLIFSPEAQAQLDELEEWIAESSGSEITAEGYIRRIVRDCRSLALFPYRGMAREDLGPGLRTTGFEDRVTILFAVTDETVTIAAILYGGRQLQPTRK